MKEEFTRRRAIEALASITVAGTVLTPAAATDGTDDATAAAGGKKVYVVPKGDGFRTEVDDAELLDGVTVERRDDEFVVRVDKSAVPSENPRSSEKVRRQKREAEAIVEAQRKEWASEAL